MRWTTKIDTVVDGFSGFMAEIRDDIKQIFLRLPPVPVAGNSPLRLTDFGVKMAAHMNAKQWASNLAPSLRFNVSEKRAFEIDEFSRTYVETSLTDDMNERVSACGYEFGVDRDNVLKVLHVVLRDELLTPTPHGETT